MDDNDAQTKVEAAKAEAAKAEYEAAAAEARAVAKYEAAKADAEAAKEGNEYKEWLEYWDKRTGLNYDEEKHGSDYSGGWRKLHYWQKLSDDCYEHDSGPVWYDKEPHYETDYLEQRKKFSRFLLGIRAPFDADYPNDKFLFKIWGHERGTFHRRFIGQNTEIDCDVYFYFLLSKSSVDDVIRLVEYEAEGEGKGSYPNLGVPVINYRISFSRMQKEKLPSEYDYNAAVQFYLSEDGGLLFKNRKELVSFKNYLKRFLQSYETKKVWRGPIKK